MKKLIAAAAVAAGLALAPAQAAIVDFALEADTNGERALPLGNPFVQIQGTWLQIGANLNFGEANQTDIYPYLDAGDAGLGACQMIDNNDQCNPGSDDNVTEGESIVLFFRNNDNTANVNRDILGLSFKDVNHNDIDENNDGLVRVQTVNGDITELFSDIIQMAANGDAFFANTVGVRFLFVDKQFYLSHLELSDVPIPGAIPLLISGLAGLGFASRKKKKQAA